MNHFTKTTIYMTILNIITELTYNFSGFTGDS